ncbi:HpcH/HpaI aldolase/citrate lyase family protein [Paracoccaceae bacterium GXU_MW_L88]
MTQYRPRRSVLYMPGSKSRALEKARGLAADALILDLEDAVAPSEKTAARELVAEAVREGGYGVREILIRINGLETEWGMEDLKMACRVGPDGILVPKVNTGAEIAELARKLREFDAPEKTKIWAMMETPLGIINAQNIAAADRMGGLVMGTNDLVKELRCEFTDDRAPVATSLSLCLLAGRAHGLPVIDGVYNAFKDDEGLERECVQGREMGFDGKTLIHPAQLDITNRVFAPSEEAIIEAREMTKAFEESMEKGEAVAVYNGKIVENLHVENAKRLIAMDDAIKAMEG